MTFLGRLFSISWVLRLFGPLMRLQLPSKSKAHPLWSVVGNMGRRQKTARWRGGQCHLLPPFAWITRPLHSIPALSLLMGNRKCFFRVSLHGNLVSLGNSGLVYQLLLSWDLTFNIFVTHPVIHLIALLMSFFEKQTRTLGLKVGKRRQSINEAYLNDTDSSPWKLIITTYW